MPKLPQEVLDQLGIQKKTWEWTDEQRSALSAIDDWYRRGSDPFFGLTGPAGVGKSTVMREVAARIDGVLLTAMTGKAAYRLSSLCKEPAYTLHAKLYWPPTSGKNPRFTKVRSPECKFIVIDEASMVTPAILRDLTQWTNHGVRVLFVGDSFQLPPVISRDEMDQFGEDYSVFSVVRTARLSQVMRSVGGIVRAATKLRESGRLPRDSDEEYRFALSRDPIRKAVEDYLEDPKDHLLVTWKNSTRMNANYLIRQRLGYTGPLPDVGEPVLIRKNGQDLLNGETVLCAGNFEAGPTLAGVRTLYMPINSERKILVSVDGGNEFLDGQQPNIQNWNLYRAAIEAYGVHDPIPITWGYCHTAHTAQGSEARRVTVFLERGDERSKNFTKQTTLPDGSKASFASRWAYTAMTRGKALSTVILP